MDHKLAHELFRYDSLTGELFWKQPGPKRNLYKPAGSKDKAGYIRIMVSGKMYLAHRIIWLLETGDWPQYTVDHVDNNPNNNRFHNLRDVPHGINMRNAKAKIGNNTGIRGINKTAQGTYTVRLQNYTVGTYKTLAEAISAKEKYNEIHPYI